MDEESRLTPPVEPTDHLRGAARAPVTLVEYGDFQCPYCGEAYPIVKEIERQVGDRVRLGFRNFPLANIHPHATAAAKAAEAAAEQGKFWEMHDLLFEHQARLGSRDLLSYAERLQLDLPRFEADFQSDAIAERVRGHFRSGVRSGVNGTPTFFVNGRRHDAGYGFAELLAAIERAELAAPASDELGDAERQPLSR